METVEIRQLKLWKTIETKGWWPVPAGGGEWDIYPIPKSIGIEGLEGVQPVCRVKVWDSAQGPAYAYIPKSVYDTLFPKREQPLGFEVNPSGNHYEIVIKGSWQQIAKLPTPAEIRTLLDHPGLTGYKSYKGVQRPYMCIKAGWRTKAEAKKALAKLRSKIDPTAKLRRRVEDHLRKNPAKVAETALMLGIN